MCLPTILAMCMPTVPIGGLSGAYRGPIGGLSGAGLCGRRDTARWCALCGPNRRLDERRSRGTGAGGKEDGESERGHSCHSLSDREDLRTLETLLWFPPHAMARHRKSPSANALHRNRLQPQTNPQHPQPRVKPSFQASKVARAQLPDADKTNPLRHNANFIANPQPAHRSHYRRAPCGRGRQRRRVPREYGHGGLPCVPVASGAGSCLRGNAHSAAPAGEGHARRARRAFPGRTFRRCRPCRSRSIARQEYIP